MLKKRGTFICAIVLLLLCVFRVLPFVVDPLLSFDSDQAVVGLMGKHLAEGLGFPLFFYGQKFLLGLEAWILGFIFWITQSSDVFKLKYTYAAFNLVSTLLLFGFAQRHFLLKPLSALFVCLPWVFCSPFLASRLMESQGTQGLLLSFILLLIATRKNTWLWGLLLGVALSYRELLVSIWIAILLIKWIERHSFRNILRWSLQSLGPALAIYFAFRSLAKFGLFTGERLPRSFLHLPFYPHTNYWDVSSQLLGLRSSSLENIGLRSNVEHFMPWYLGLLGILSLIALVTHVLRKSWLTYVCHPYYRAEIIWIGAAFINIVMYQFLSAHRDTSSARYLLIFWSALIPSFSILIKSTKAPSWSRRIFYGVTILLLSPQAVTLLKLTQRHSDSPATQSYRQIEDGFKKGSLEVGVSEYWTAYLMSYLSGETIVLSPPQAEQRISLFRERVEEARRSGRTIVDVPALDPQIRERLKADFGFWRKLPQ